MPWFAEHTAAFYGDHWPAEQSHGAPSCLLASCGRSSAHVTHHIIYGLGAEQHDMQLSQ